MIEEQLIASITEALKTDGFVGLAKQKSSRSVTVTANKGERRAVIHIADPEPAPGPRSGVNAELPDTTSTVTRAFVPTPAGGSGASTNGSTPAAVTGTAS